jgi:hypothetical protein
VHWLHLSEACGHGWTIRHLHTLAEDMLHGVLPDRPSRHEDVLAFGNDVGVSPLGFSSTMEDMKALLHNDRSEQFSHRTASLFRTSAIRS